MLFKMPIFDAPIMPPYDSERSGKGYVLDWQPPRTEPVFHGLPGSNELGR